MIPFELVSANSILLQNRPYGLFILLLQPHFTMRHLFLLNLYNRTKYMGEVIHIDHIEQGIAFFFDNHNEVISEERDHHLNFFNSYLRKQEFLSNEGAFEEFCLAPKGYQRVDDLQKYNSSNPNVFVSMAFNDNTKSTREAIREGIIDAGYSPKFIDEIIHNIKN